ncbi:MAG: hypothetical protein GXP61_01430 [Epsilonproteobacteria bacterium]|nr:hypothetical protein [Campylobacterota bacterium]
MKKFLHTFTFFAKRGEDLYLLYIRSDIYEYDIKEITKQAEEEKPFNSFIHRFKVGEWYFTENDPDTKICGTGIKEHK